jgi:hypothetical protein
MELSGFRAVFGDGPAVRLLDYLLDNKYVEFSLTDVLRGASISYNTVRPVWNGFVRAHVLVPAGKVGKAQQYRLNMRSTFVKQLIALDRTVVEQKL